MATILQRGWARDGRWATGEGQQQGTAKHNPESYAANPSDLASMILRFKGASARMFRQALGLSDMLACSGVSSDQRYMFNSKMNRTRTCFHISVMSISIPIYL